MCTFHMNLSMSLQYTEVEAGTATAHSRGNVTYSQNPRGKRSIKMHGRLYENYAFVPAQNDS